MGGVCGRSLRNANFLFYLSCFQPCAVVMSDENEL